MASRKSSSSPTHGAPKGKPVRFTRRYERVEDMPVVHRKPCGIDLSGADAHFTALEIDGEREVKEFGIMTPDLVEIVSYTLLHKVTSVAMEATGVYWMVLYDMLELAGIEVYLVNPTHIKQVPGRAKDDKLDAIWLMKLHKYGLLSASFRPSEQFRPLRSFYRQRKRLVELSADEVRRMQKALDMMNVRIHQAISDLAGQTGLRLVRAIVAGERDPEKLAALRDPRCRCTTEELVKALTGFYVEHLVFELSQALARYDALLLQIAEVDAQIELVFQRLLPAADQDGVPEDALATVQPPAPKGKHVPGFNVASYVQRITGHDPTVIPGIGPMGSLGLLAELGTDMTKWETSKHFGSFLRIAPMKRISGGKQLSVRTAPGLHPAAVIFLQAAAAVSRSDTALGAFYRHLAVRIGKGKAMMATAYKIARMYYNLMRYGQQYVEIGEAKYNEKYHKRQLATLAKRATQLGMTLVPAAA